MRTNIIEYIVRTKKLNQKEIATRLGVSTTQVSKWKKGEYVSFEKREELAKLAGLFGDDPDWAILVASKENATRWLVYFTKLLEFLDTRSLYQFTDEPEIYVPRILLLLNSLGAQIPSSPPPIEVYNDQENEPVALETFLFNFLEEYSPRINWCNRHFISVDDDELMETQWELEAYAPEITLHNMGAESLASIGITEEQFKPFWAKTSREIRTLIYSYCEKLIALKLPLRTEYFHYLYKDADSLRDMTLFDDISDSTEHLLPHGERLILSESTKTNRLLTELHEKLDRLLGEESKG